MKGEGLTGRVIGWGDTPLGLGLVKRERIEGLRVVAVRESMVVVCVCGENRVAEEEDDDGKR